MEVNSGQPDKAVSAWLLRTVLSSSLSTTTSAVSLEKERRLFGLGSDSRSAGSDSIDMKLFGLELENCEGKDLVESDLKNPRICS